MSYTSTFPVADEFASIKETLDGVDGWKIEHTDVTNKSAYPQQPDIRKITFKAKRDGASLVLHATRTNSWWYEGGCITQRTERGSYCKVKHIYSCIPDTKSDARAWLQSMLREVEIEAKEAPRLETVRKLKAVAPRSCTLQESGFTYVNNGVNIRHTINFCRVDCIVTINKKYSPWKITAEASNPNNKPWFQLYTEDTFGGTTRFVTDGADEIYILTSSGKHIAIHDEPWKMTRLDKELITLAIKAFVDKVQSV